MAADVVELLAEVGPAVVVGHSMGGLHGLVAAAARPELVRALVIEDMGVDFVGRSAADARAWFGALPSRWPALAAVSEAFGAPQLIGASFLGRYVLTFEATSVLLLIAAVGGVTLAARRPAPREEGAIGAFEVQRPVTSISLQADVVDAETRFDVVRAGRARDEDGEG